ncbi:hypothetical protein QEN19_001431 [Hanseniaspora menglaensis]
MSFPIITTAPGKVILSGEHSAVYGKEVIASAVKNLRCYMLVEDLVQECDKENNESNFIELSFPDLHLDQKWNIKEDLGIILDEKTLFSSIAEAPTAFNTKLSDLIESEVLAKDVSSTAEKTGFSDYHYSAKMVFLYLFLHIAPNIKNKKFTLKSNVPVGAGLGSSASVSVCLVLAFLYCINGNKKIDDLELVNSLSLLGEKCVHGTPSGIDNAVATYGKAIRLTTSNYNTENQVKKLSIVENFPDSLSMLLVNTKIPKSTKTLVANVRELYNADSKYMDDVLNCMHRCSVRMIDNFEKIKKLEALDLQANTKENSEEYKEELSRLFNNIRMNHGFLVTLGVSHPGLEKIKILSDELKVGGTKLTGAGGGGCAMTILDPLNKKEANLTEFIKTLQDGLGYDVYKTQLGGVGAFLIPKEAISQDLAKAFLVEQKLSLKTVTLLNAMLP